MIYVIGILGFVAGFVLGQVLLSIWLKDRSRKDLLTDKALQMRYGLFNWGLAALTAYTTIRLYQIWFTGAP